MPPRPNARNWNDVQTAIATIAIATTLGMWNLFAKPAQAETTQAEGQEPILPSNESPIELPVAAEPALMPQVKIMFTSIAPQTTTVNQQTQEKKKKKKKNNNNGDGGGAVQTITQTQSS
jgi:hypothetical protein